MQLTRLCIKNFKSIAHMEIKEIENALILVGKNNTGKTSVLDAIRAVTGSYRVTASDFNMKRQNVEIEVTLEITEEDLRLLHRRGAVSKYKRYDAWQQDFQKKLPSFNVDNGQLSFTYVVNIEGNIRYTQPGGRKDNLYFREVLPSLHYIDTDRELKGL